MDKVGRVALLAGLVSVAWLMWASLRRADEGPPNVLVFLSDDQGWGDDPLGNPDSKIAMPNLERLEREGMRFTTAYSPAAVCSPSRYAILTGNYPYRGTEPWGVWHTAVSDFREGQRTLGDVLRAAGYATAFVGKWHVGAKIDGDRLVTGPLAHGFDESYVMPNALTDKPCAFFENDQLERGTQGRSPGDLKWLAQVGGRLVTHAVDFIDRVHRRNLAEGKRTPFFLYYSSQSAHQPWVPPRVMGGTPIAGATGMTRHTDMVYQIDVELGILLHALDERGLTAHTLILFSSDNGGIPEERTTFGHDSVGGLSGRKGTPYEGGVRVPFVAKWGDGTAHSRIAPGTVRQQMVCSTDWMATLADLTGQRLDAATGCDSFDLLPVLLGQRGDDAPLREEVMLQSGGSGGKQCILVAGGWKLCLDETGQHPLELFDLAHDPTESTNRLQDEEGAAVAQRLRVRYQVLRNAPRTVRGEGAVPVAPQEVAH